MTDEASPGDFARPWVRSVDLAGWPGLHLPTRIEFGEKVSVLVGRNGAGKSLLLGTFELAADLAVSPSPASPPWARRLLGVAHFRCDVQDGDRVIAYSYTRSASEAEEDLVGSGTEGPHVEMSERCWNPVTSEEFWRVDGGTLHLPSQPTIAIPCGLLGWLGYRRPESTTFPEEAATLFSLLARVTLVPAGVPRGDVLRRSDVLLTRGGPPPPGTPVRPARRAAWRSNSPGRINRLAMSLANLQERDVESFNEFVELAKQLGLAQEVAVRVYEDPNRDKPAEERVDIASVVFNDENLGLLSDGTLRVAEILLALVRPGGGFLLVEEPETAVHPGLLSKILALLDSYAADRQIIVSTHSPLVVSWSKPGSIRLVVRRDGHTAAPALTAEETTLVNAYLSEEGSLGEFIFLRAMS